MVSSAFAIDHAAFGSKERPSPFAQWLRELFPHVPEVSANDWESVIQALARHPQRAREIQDRYYRLHFEIWSELLSNAPATTAVEPQPGDQRFKGPDWDNIPWFRYLKRTYLANVRWATELIEIAELPHRQRQRLRFVLRHWLDAAAPSNFLSTNPEALRLASETSGASLLQGMQRLNRDASRGRIEMSDEQAFEVGRTLAITPGAVVYQNPVVQLIQYEPRCAQVRERPLYIVPPFINKYYVLDLRPENSFVRYALEQGFQVFIVSWRNVGPALGSLTWEDYIQQGVLEPMQVAREISGANRLNALGFCVGGTLLATALATAPERTQVGSLTLLASLLDFDDVGEISAYIDEQFVRQCEENFRDGGVMPGSTLASAFASLRANELVWFYVVNNYLKGKAPRAFDLLYWNSDSANVPGKLYAWYLRNAYLENNLREPGKVELRGQPLDFSVIDVPTMLVAAREDHIVPWRSAYASGALLAGKIEFVLSASGHIAGIVNPPSAKRREYWLNHARPHEPEEWLSHAERVAGSWWPHWSEWLKAHSGALIEAPAELGNGRYPPAEPAPGSYVREPA
jgi:polyhydroxyalkanoate synthase